MKVFITGITGTLGTELAKYHARRGHDVSGCCRSESKLAAWRTVNNGHGLALLGDCRLLADETSDIYRHFASADKVYHCAALKHVDLCEQQPVEAYRQNLQTCDIVSFACMKRNIPLIFISSDKACLPQGVYGATKLIGEQIVLSRGGGVVRFGNLIGSSGSVFQKWADSVKRDEPITLTDPYMTRYFIPVSVAAEFAAERAAVERARIPLMKSIAMGEIATHIGAACVIIGRRPGETQHQWLVAPDEPYSEIDGGIEIGSGSASEHGLSSSSAPRWVPQELLYIATGSA